jgi:hypothetical protein
MKRDAIEAINLPAAGRKLEAYHVREPRRFERPARPFTRIAYAAAHVVADPWSAKEPWLDAAVDWDATIAFAGTCGRGASAWPRRWTRRSAAWAWTGLFLSN